MAAAQRANDECVEQKAHGAIDRAKRALGERGPGWWRDGAPDLNRHIPRNTSYADWFARHADALEAEHGDSGAAGFRKT